MVKTSPVEKFLVMADKMQKDIDHKMADRQENTPKRQKEAASARIDGRRLQRTQMVLRMLVHLYETGLVPEVLLKIKSKKDIFENMRSKLEQNNGGYYAVAYDTQERKLDTPEAIALWDLLVETSEEDKKEEELKRKVSELKFAKIPGYFPTPKPLIGMMLEKACIGPDDSVLEPSAGSGAIVDCIRECHPDTQIYVYEVNNSLLRILELKNYEIMGEDFLQDTPTQCFDRIIMNPPFEKLQDIDHVKHAYNCLKENGRLVSIMSPGPFFRSDKKSKDFREWFEKEGGGVEDIPMGSFKESGTMVSSKLITLDKEI